MSHGAASTIGPSLEPEMTQTGLLCRKALSSVVSVPEPHPARNRPRPHHTCVGLAPPVRWRHLRCILEPSHD
jgi:hypothetical protein